MLKYITLTYLKAVLKKLRMRKMKIWNNKSKLSAIAFVIILTFAAIYVALPIVSAHDPAWEVPNWAYISVTNNPIGVNQQLVILY